MGNLFSADSTPSTARFYEGITLQFANPKKEFPQDFHPERPHKTVSLGRVSRVGFVDFLSGRNGLAKVLLLENFRFEDPTKSKPQSPLDCELRNNATYIVIPPTPPIPEFYEGVTLVLPLENGFCEDFDPEHPGSETEVVKLRNLSQQGFVSFLAGRNAEFVVTPEDYPSRGVSKMFRADVELRDGATYIVLPRKGKNYEQTVDDVAAWQPNQTEADERMLVARAINELKKDSGKGTVAELSGLVIKGALAGALETSDVEDRDEMHSLFVRNNCYKWLEKKDYGDDPCSPFQAPGVSCCDPPAPTAPPSAVPRRGGRSFLASMRGPAMLVRPRLVNNRVAGFRLTI